MVLNIEKPISKLFNDAKIKVDRRLFIFSFFLIISTIFWFLSALNKEYTSSIIYPVRFQSFPDDKILVGELPKSLTLAVNAYGFKLLHYKLSPLRPIFIDVNAPYLTPIRKGDTTNYFIHTAVVKHEIARQLSPDVQIKGIQPDSIIFQFTNIIGKKVAIRPDIIIEFEKQYMQKGKMIIKPDSITIWGPQTIIDTMEYIKTEQINLFGINSSIKRKLGFLSNKNIKIYEKEVNIEIPVEKFTESSLKINIEVINLPDTLILRTFPSEVEVTYLVGLSDFDKVRIDQFRAIADFEDIDKNLSNRLRIQLVKFPKDIKSVKTHPTKIEYIIEKSKAHIIDN
jgi:hypothetical protein